MWLVDQLHQGGIGVILGLVCPAHFTKDAGLHGTGYEFDGEPCYEVCRPPEIKRGGARRLGHLGLPGVLTTGEARCWSYLYSSALFWLEQYHIRRGLRVGGCGGHHGSTWTYGRQGRASGCPTYSAGHRRICEAVFDFLQQLNTPHFQRPQTDVMMIRRGVHRLAPGFPFRWNKAGTGGRSWACNLKWNMKGWMSDILHYIKMDPTSASINHHDITFSLMYAFL